MSDSFSFQLQWNGKKHVFDVSSSALVEDLQKKLFEISQVEPANQKIMGLGKQQPSSDTRLDSLHLKKPTKIILLAGKQDLKKDEQDEVFLPLFKHKNEVDQISESVMKLQTEISNHILSQTSFNKEKVEFELRKCDNRLNQIVEYFDTIDMTEKSQKFREVRKGEIQSIQKIQDIIDRLLKKI